MSVPNRISTVAHGATPITGLSGFDISTEDAMTAVHVDADTYNSYVDIELGGGTVTLNGIDFEQYQALINAAAADLVIVCTECGASTSTTFTLENAIALPVSFSASDQGNIGTGSITFGIVGDDGTDDGIAIASA